VVPASVANLGGGFDTLAVAVQLYLRVRIIDVRPDGGGRLTVVRSIPSVRGRNAVERAYEAIVQRVGPNAPSV
jgi:homoserine kinase